MSKTKKKKTYHMDRSDIPYAERLRMNKLANIANHRDDAHLVELKLSLVSLNQCKGMGCVQLARYAKLQNDNREKYYADPEYESVKLDQAVRQLGFIVEDGRLVCILDEDGKVIPTYRAKEIPEV